MQILKPKILFLCTGNSCRSQMAEGWAKALRSQMAEGWAKALRSDCIDAYSAGVDRHGMNERAVQVMAECGIDISRQHSKHVDELVRTSFDYVITVCDHAHETCPLLPGARVVHVGFDDPPRLARDAKTDDEALAHYRRVRDEIRRFVERLPDDLERIYSD